MRIAIVDAGWCRCRLAAVFDALEMQMKFFEQHKRLLHGASGNNQFRLHHGFHSSRHSDTRMRSRDRFMRFVERYPNLSAPVPLNIYAVPRYECLVSFLTYGPIATRDGLLMLSRSRKYSGSKLTACLEFAHRILHVGQRETDVLVDGKTLDSMFGGAWRHFPRTPRAYAAVR